MASCCLKGTLPTQYITQKNALLSQIDTCTHTFMGLLVIYKLGIESSDKSLFICAYIYIYYIICLIFIDTPSIKMWPLMHWFLFSLRKVPRVNKTRIVFDVFL